MSGTRWSEGSSGWMRYFFFLLCWSWQAAKLILILILRWWKVPRIGQRRLRCSSTNATLLHMEVCAWMVDWLRQLSFLLLFFSDDLSIAKDGRDPYEALKQAGKLKYAFFYFPSSQLSRLQDFQPDWRRLHDRHSQQVSLSGCCCFFPLSFRLCLLLCCCNSYFCKINRMLMMTRDHHNQADSIPAALQEQTKQICKVSKTAAPFYFLLQRQSKIYLYLEWWRRSEPVDSSLSILANEQSHCAVQRRSGTKGKNTKSQNNKLLHRLNECTLRTYSFDWVCFVVHMRFVAAKWQNRLRVWRLRPAT